MSVALDDLIRKRVLPRFPVAAGASVRALPGGLINRTFLVGEPSGGDRFILQKIHPVFPPAIHQNIRAVTEALRRAGMTTQTLVPADDGQPFLELTETPPAERSSSVWRLMTYVEGTTFDVVAGAAQAYPAGALVARFHDALWDLPHRFVGLRTSVHDTPAHLARLAQAVAGGGSHRLFAQVAALADDVGDAVQALPPLPSAPARICHGDLKFNNLLFAGRTAPASEQAVCLIDLDTVAPLALAYELGDAWRSWCNRAGEDSEQAVLDLQVLEASFEGYRATRSHGLDIDERRGLLLGPEWVSLELSARFAADALMESYFGWDSRRFPGRGEHNLARARGQLSLHRAFVGSRPRRQRLLGVS